MNRNESYLNLASNAQCKELIMTLSDNTEYEYVRVGFGRDNKGLYVVDLDDIGVDLRQKIYINVSLEEALQKGVEQNVLVQYEDGSYAYNMADEEVDFFDYICKLNQHTHMNNPKHPLYGRSYSSITEDELQDLTEEEYQEYQEWGVMRTLKYMMDEGMVEEFECPETGETLYRLTPEMEARQK